MATDEVAVAVDHRKDPLDSGDMDLSGEEHVPKVRQGPAALRSLFHCFHAPNWRRIAPGRVAAESVPARVF
jgi:hypothetical protein